MHARLRKRRLCVLLLSLLSLPRHPRFGVRLSILLLPFLLLVLPAPNGPPVLHVLPVVVLDRDGHHAPRAARRSEAARRGGV